MLIIYIDNIDTVLTFPIHWEVNDGSVIDNTISSGLNPRSSRLIWKTGENNSSISLSRVSSVVKGGTPSPRELRLACCGVCVTGGWVVGCWGVFGVGDCSGFTYTVCG